MFNIGDTVLFGTEGVFVIEQITQKEICGKTADYYALKSKFKDNSVVYLPVANKELTGKIRPLMTEDEIIELLGNISESDDMWVEDNKLRKDKFMEILQGGCREDIIKLAGTIYHRQQTLKLNHRKLSLADERILKEAERIISMEFSFVLNIEQKDVGEYIRSHMKISQ